MLLASIEKIVKSDTRFVKVDGELVKKKHPNTKKESQQARLRQKFDKLFEQRREAVLHDRLTSLSTSKAMKYALNGDEFHLRQELTLGHPINEVDARSGRTVLLESVAGGYLHLVRMLIYEYNADLSCVTTLGKASALHIAVEFSHRQIASMLITHGADVNKRDMFGRTPLHLVKTANVLKLLLKFPAVDVVARSNKGLTPLGHYLKSTPSAERVDEIVQLLSVREDRRLLEITKEQVANIKAEREHMMTHMGLVTDISTVGRFQYHEEDSKPW